MGKRRSKVVRASAFEVVDDEGRVRATLDCDDQGPGLRLWSHDGNAVAVVAVGDDEAGYVVVAAADGTVLRSLVGKAAR